MSDAPLTSSVQISAREVMKVRMSDSFRGKIPGFVNTACFKLVLFGWPVRAARLQGRLKLYLLLTLVSQETVSLGLSRWTIRSNRSKLELARADYTLSPSNVNYLKGMRCGFEILPKVTK